MLMMMMMTRMMMMTMMILSVCLNSHLDLQKIAFSELFFNTVSVTSTTKYIMKDRKRFSCLVC